MSIFNIINNIKDIATTISGSSSTNYGDISEYDNRSTTKYPYINLDIVDNSVVNGSVKSYTIRVYVMDRNEPYDAYTKCGLILDTLFKKLSIQEYQTNYFTSEFNDIVHGVYSDILFDTKLSLACVPYTGKGYVLLENGDFIARYLLNEDGHRVELDT